MQTEEQQQKSDKNFWIQLIISITLLPIVMWIWPWFVPFRFFEFWSVRGTVTEWLFAAWPAFAWGTGVTLVYSLFTKNDSETNHNAEQIFISETEISVVAGVFEEITFRWLFFLNNIVLIKVGNFLFFGFLGFGLVEWLHLNVFGPLANWFTLGGLEPYIFHTTGWAVGAAMLATNYFFRGQHKYLGLRGTINSWFVGMFFFWIMFKFGLPVAIFVHFVYNFLIFAVRYLDAAAERALYQH